MHCDIALCGCWEMWDNWGANVVRHWWGTGEALVRHWWSTGEVDLRHLRHLRVQRWAGTAALPLFSPFPAAVLPVRCPFPVCPHPCRLAAHLPCGLWCCWCLRLLVLCLWLLWLFFFVFVFCRDFSILPVLAPPAPCLTAAFLAFSPCFAEIFAHTCLALFCVILTQNQVCVSCASFLCRSGFSSLALLL